MDKFEEGKKLLQSSKWQDRCKGITEICESYEGHKKDFEGRLIILNGCLEDRSKKVRELAKKRLDGQAWTSDGYEYEVIERIFPNRGAMGIHVTSDIAKLASRLEGNDTIRKLEAVCILGKAALHGIDISEAVPGLVRLIDEDKEAIVKEYAAETLGKAARNKETRAAVISSLMELLGDEDSVVYKTAGAAFVLVFEDEESREMLLEALNKEIELCEDEFAFDETAYILGKITRNEKNQPYMIDVLERYVESGDIGTKNLGIAVLGWASLNGVDTNRFTSAFVDALEDENYQREAAHALHKVVSGGGDITECIDGLIKMSSTYSYHASRVAIEALVVASEKGQTSLDDIKERIRKIGEKDGRLERGLAKTYGAFVKRQSELTKSKLDMPGELLPDKPKPPGGKTFRRRAIAK